MTMCSQSLKRLTIMFASMSIASMAIMAVVGRENKEIDFSTVTLNAGTSSFFANDQNGIPLQSDCLSVAGLDALLSGLQQRAKPKHALWLGNSQLHAINQYQEGQVNALPLVRESLKSFDLDLVALSPPNGTLIEHYILLEYMLSRTRLDKVILAVCFDDTREVDVRPSIRGLLERRELLAKLKTSQEGAALVEKYEGGNKGSTVPTSTRKGFITWQERVETFLNRKMCEYSSLWAARERIRGVLSLKAFQIRNMIFGITAQSKRPILPARYVENMLALQALLGVAKRERIEVLIYVTPVRHDIDLPYVAAEYADFKKQVMALACPRSQVDCRNFETLIPAALWGKKESTVGDKQLEIDFMHFQAPGHKILADEVLRWITRSR